MLPGRVRRSLQPGGNTGRVHDLPSGKTRQRAVSGYHHSRTRRADTPYYTNSSHLPVGYTADIFDALDIQDELQTLYTSGTVFHAFLGEKLPELESGGNAGTEDRGELQPAVLYTVTDLF